MIPDRMPTPDFPEGEVSSCRSGSLISQLPVYPSPPQVPGGGYAIVTGTSFAAPFVSGSAALLMEWGIVKGNDPFLYGEKVKAYLRKGAQRVGGYEEYPNVEVGWGEDVIIRLH